MSSTGPHKSLQCRNTRLAREFCGTTLGLELKGDTPQVSRKKQDLRGTYMGVS